MTKTKIGQKVPWFLSVTTGLQEATRDPGRDHTPHTDLGVLVPTRPDLGIETSAKRGHDQDHITGTAPRAMIGGATTTEVSRRTDLNIVATRGACAYHLASVRGLQVGHRRPTIRTADLEKITG